MSHDARGDPAPDVNPCAGEHGEGEVARRRPERIDEEVEGVAAQCVGPGRGEPENYRRRIAALDLGADRWVLRGNAGAREVTVRPEDPRPRAHALLGHASVFALQRTGQPRLALTAGGEADVAALGAVHLVVSAPPGEESHPQAGAGADEPDRGARLGLAGLERLDVLCTQQRDAVADRREVVDERAGRDPDVGGQGSGVHPPREVRRPTFVPHGRARHPDAGPLRSRVDLRTEGPPDGGEPRVGAAGIGPVLSNGGPTIQDLHQSQARVGSPHIAGEDVHGTGRASRAAAGGSRNHTPCRARTAGISLAEGGASLSSARATAVAFSLPVTSTATWRAGAMSGGVIGSRPRRGLGLSTTTTRPRWWACAGGPGKSEAVCPSGPMPRTSTSSAAGNWRS